MLLLDTNIIIYACQPQHAKLRDLIEKNTSSVSVITTIEALGYHMLKPHEQRLIEKLFDTVDVLGLTDNVAKTAIQLRQRKRLSLGDSIIAATTIENNLTLVTHNAADFKGIRTLNLLDPIK